MAESTEAQPRRKRLVLHIAVNAVFADDLESLAAELDCTVLDILEEELKFDCGVVIANQPGDGNLTHEFEVTAHQGLIVGAHVIDVQGS